MHTFKIYYASMSVRFIVEPKCTLAASRAAVVSHVQYAPRALSRLEKRWDRRTDGRTSDRCNTLTASRGQRVIKQAYAKYLRLNINVLSNLNIYGPSKLEN